MNRKLFIAVLLSTILGPGAGQIYNKEWKKGVAMIFSFLALFAGFFFYFARAAKQSVEALAGTHPEMILQKGAELAIAKQILEQNKGVISTAKWCLIIFWIYGIVDAYWRAKRKIEGVTTP